MDEQIGEGGGGESCPFGFEKFKLEKAYKGG